MKSQDKYAYINSYLHSQFRENTRNRFISFSGALCGFVVASLYGGLAISVTGTAFPRTLGYFLSEQYGIPHGNACAVYLEEFIRHNSNAAQEESKCLFAELGTDAESLSALIRKNLPDIGVSLTEEKIASLLPRYEDNKSLKKCYGNVDKDFAADILRRLFSCR